MRDEARLSQREQRTLAEIEEALGEDRALRRRLRTLRRGGVREGRRRLSLAGHRAGLALALLGALTLGLLVLAVTTGRPILVWAFAAAWVVTPSCLVRLVIRWSRNLEAKS